RRHGDGEPGDRRDGDPHRALDHRAAALRTPLRSRFARGEQLVRSLPQALRRQDAGRHGVEPGRGHPVRARVARHARRDAAQPAHAGLLIRIDDERERAMGTGKEAISRRNGLQLGLSTAALLAMPPMRWIAKADPTNPHFLVMLFGDGGWDPTQTVDVHDPLDTTDGIDVDVPQAISGLPPSQIATAGGITYISNPITRPAVDTYFQNWGAQSCVVNGIGTRSTSHDQSRQLVLTGSLDPTRADFAVIAAAKNGPDMPLPHLLLSGQSFGGAFAGLSGRLGGQMG